MCQTLSPLLTFVGYSSIWGTLPLILPYQLLHIVKSQLRGHLLREAFFNCPKQHLVAYSLGSYSPFVDNLVIDVISADVALTLGTDFSWIFRAVLK